MKTLIFNGSPRVKGDTAALLERLLGRLEGEYMVVDAYRCGVSPCVDCRYCWEHPGCAIKDGMEEIYDYIKECDNVLIASPIYYSELTGKLLDVASRLQTFYSAWKFRHEETGIKPKKGAIILVGGGDGAMDKAAGTARMLLRQMKCKDIHPLVSSHNTNNVPAAQDEEALAGAESVARFFNEGVSFGE